MAKLRPVAFFQIHRFASSLESVWDSLASKGYLRPHKPYNPPEDAKHRLDTIFSENLGLNHDLTNGKTKFKVLNACFKEFNHSVPNSMLHKISTKDDIRNFYLTTVDVRVPLEKFKSVELPPNVHIQYDYHRFHPETDTMFNGVSAFPQSNTVVTGLKYKKKYAGYYSKPKGY